MAREGFDPTAPLLPYQVRWVENRAPIKIAVKSRRIGITWATAYEGVEVACSRDGYDVWYSVTNEDDARLFVEDAADWARALSVPASDIGEHMIEDEARDILAFRIRFASGHKLTGLSSNPRRLRGKEGLYIDDESAYNERLSETLAAANAFDMWGVGRIALISTHNGVGSQFNHEVQRALADPSYASVQITTITEALEDGLYRRICQKLGVAWTQEGETAWLDALINRWGDRAEQELFCIPAGGGSRFFLRQDVERCMQERPVLRLQLPADFSARSEIERTSEVAAWCRQHLDPALAAVPPWARMNLGVDFGRVSDLTVAVPLYLDASMVRQVPFVVELRNVPFEQQRQVLWWLGDAWHKSRRLDAAYMDAGGIGADTAEQASQRWGATVRAVYLAGGPPRDDDRRTDTDGQHGPSLRYSEAMPGLRKAFEDAAIVVPRYLDLLEDLELVERRDGHPTIPPRRTRGTDRGYRHGDAAVAMMLAHYASASFVRLEPRVEFRPRQRSVRL